MDRKQATILGVKIDSTTQGGVIMFVARKLTSREKFYIVTPNPEILLMASRDNELHNILNDADLSIPDGIGILWVQKLIRGVPVIRLPGRNVMVELLKFADDKKLSVFFLGSSEKVMAKTLKKVNQEFPGVKAYGARGPLLSEQATPILESDTAKELAVIKRINQIEPDLLFVAFGAPKQEKWIAKHTKELKIGGAMVIGGSLDTYSGIIKPVPGWMAHMGLEWLWRVIQEPRRIGRIVNAVIVFPVVVLLEKLRGK